jgi:hypothetical protein
MTRKLIDLPVVNRDLDHKVGLLTCKRSAIDWQAGATGGMMAVRETGDRHGGPYQEPESQLLALTA